MSTITCNEDMKDNAKCKNSRFEPFCFVEYGIQYGVKYHDGHKVLQ